MNKKIFTLLASSLMLFLTAIVMNAQVNMNYGSPVQNLPEGMGKGAYHLKVSQVGLTPIPDPNAPLLSLSSTGMLQLTTGLAAQDYKALRAALWCVNVSKWENNGKYPVYNFINKQYSSLLAVDSDRWADFYTNPALGTIFYGVPIQVMGGGKSDQVYTNGQFSDWGFAPDYDVTLSQNKPLLIECPDDPGFFLTFAYPYAGTLAAGAINSNIELVKVSYADLQPGAVSGFADNFLVRFTLVTAAPRVLTANDFNETLGTNVGGKTSQLFFTPDVAGAGNENVFTNKLHAVESVNNNPNYVGSNVYNVGYYMNFNNNASATKDLKWIYVADSVNKANYYNDLGQWYPKIKFDGTRITDPTKSSPNNNDINQKGLNYEYDFRLIYYPSEDSVVMNVRGIDHIDTNKGYKGDGTVYDPATDGTGTYDLGDKLLFNIEILNFLTVHMQDLTEKSGDRVITIANDPAHTRIHFGNNTCAADDKTTVPRDLYVIRDNQNRYLVMPLETGDFTPRWEELRENEDPMKTPSYQWLVVPMNENSPTSPIKLINREFNWVEIQAVQVRSKAATFTGHVNWLYMTTPYVDTDYRINDDGAKIYYPGKVSTDTYLDIAKQGLHWDLKEGWNGSFLKVQDDQKAAAKKETGVAMTQEEMQKLHRTGKYLGYKFIDEASLSYYTYAFNYLHKFSSDYYLGLNKENNPNDTTVYVTQRKNYFRLEITQDLKDYGTEKYGIGWGGEYDASPNTEDIAPLERYYYHFMENDYWNFLFDNHYIVIDDNGRYGFSKEYTANTRTREAGVFYLRFTYQPQGKPEYYSMIERLKESSVKHYLDVLGLQMVQVLKPLDMTHDGQYVVSGKDSLGVMILGIDQMNLYARTQVKAVGVKTVSTFSVDNSIEPLYRRFNEGVYPGIAGAQADDGGTAGNDDPRIVKIYRSNNPFTDYLYEDQLSGYASKSCMNCPPFNKVDNGINFLGMENIYDHAAAGPEHAKLGHNYAIYLDTAYVNRGTGTIKPQYLLVMDPQIKEEWYCTDCETVKGDYIYGRYLINATDSAWYNTNGVLTKRDEAYLWDSYWERLAFVPAIHIRDTLFVLNGHQIEEFFYPIPGTNEQGLHLTLLSRAAHDGKHKVKAIYLGNNYHKDVVFSMRFIAQGDYENFLLESETTNRDWTKGRMIAPMTGGWVKLQNNEVPVITRGSYWDAIKEAGIWNTEPTTDAPVANDQVAVTAVKVIAGQGNVSILNAAGKQVTISNILGQTVASAVLTSDNATINAPKGVLVVAVEGENAVKAVVK